MNYSQFLTSLLEQIHKVNLDISGLPIDHIAYQASSKQDYEQLLPEFSKLGTLISEEIIANRRVAVLELHEPIIYKSYSIPALELIEPKDGQECESHLQHAEFIADKPFEEYITQYPELDWDTSSMSRDEFTHLKLHFDNGLTLKFLKKPILELLKQQNEKRQ